MRVFNRLDKLKVKLAPEPMTFMVVECIPVDSDCKKRAPGAYLNSPEGGAQVVFTGSDPDPALFKPIRHRMTNSTLLIVLHPDRTSDPPGTDLQSLSQPPGTKDSPGLPNPATDCHTPGR